MQRISYTIFGTPLGKMYALYKDEALLALGFQRGEEEPSLAAPFKKRLKDCQVERDELMRSLLVERLRLYLNGMVKNLGFKEALPFSTPFEKEVYKALKEVPYGQTITYKGLAERIGRKEAARAVARALANNPLPILIPCHRVIRGDGSLGGYSEGIEIKESLLKLERAMPSH